MSSQTERPDAPLTPDEEEHIILTEIRKARAALYSDVLISFHKGYMDKCDVTIKRRGDALRSTRRLKES